MQSLQDFWSTVFLAQFKLEEEPPSSSDRSRFCGLFGLLVGLLHQWFLSGQQPFLSLFPREISHKGAYLSDRNGRHPASDKKSWSSWSLGECLLQAGNSMLVPHLQWAYIFSTLPFRFKTSIILSSAECDFGILYYRSKTLLSLLAHILLNLLLHLAFTFYLYLSNNRFPGKVGFWKYGIIE